MTHQRLRATDMLTIGNRTQQIKAWAAEAGLTVNGLVSRMRRGMTGADIVAPKTNKPGRGTGIQYSKTTQAFQPLGIGQRKLRKIQCTAKCYRHDCGALAYSVDPRTGHRTPVCTVERGCFR